MPLYGCPLPQVGCYTLHTQLDLDQGMGPGVERNTASVQVFRRRTNFLREPRETSGRIGQKCWEKCFNRISDRQMRINLDDAECDRAHHSGEREGFLEATRNAKHEVRTFCSKTVLYRMLVKGLRRHG